MACSTPIPAVLFEAGGPGRPGVRRRHAASRSAPGLAGRRIQRGNLDDGDRAGGGAAPRPSHFVTGVPRLGRSAQQPAASGGPLESDLLFQVPIRLLFHSDVGGGYGGSASNSAWRAARRRCRSARCGSGVALGGSAGPSRAAGTRDRQPPGGMACRRGGSRRPPGGGRWRRRRRPAPRLGLRRGASGTRSVRRWRRGPRV